MEAKISFGKEHKNIENVEKKPTGRFAPSPTGYLHIGNAWAALMSWLSVRSQEGKMILRIEDLDPQRSKPQFVNSLIEDLEWLGLDWDRGPTKKRKEKTYYQSERRHLYEAALNQLKKNHEIYPCFCTRKDLQMASAPHGKGSQSVYSGYCSRLSKIEIAKKMIAETYSFRIKVPEEIVSFSDMNLGVQKQNLKMDCGDIGLTRRDGVHAYQLAVVVDDALMGVTEVVRGADLVSSTPRQIFLHKSLGYTPPRFGHVPLIVNKNYCRLSKRDGALTLKALRENGVKGEKIIGWLAYKGGLIRKYMPVLPSQLIEDFSWSKCKKSSIEMKDDNFKI